MTAAYEASGVAPAQRQGYKGHGMEVVMVRRTVAVLAACGLLFAACSSEDDEDGMTVINQDDGFFNSGMAGNSPQRGGPIPGSCAEGSAQASRVVPTVMLVLDGSCSMSTDYPSSGQSATSCRNNPNSRWSALRNALLAPDTGVVTRLQSFVEFGVAIYGTTPQCPITGQIVNPAKDNLAAIEAAFPQTEPGQFTPTGLALDQVYDQVLAGLANAPDREGPVIVLLATDGEPNSCDDATTNYQPSVDAVTRIAGAGVTTYVVSLASAAGEFHDHLQMLANIGDPANASAPLYEPTNPEDLSADLEQLIGGAVGCEVALNGTISEGGECQGTVELNSVALTCNDENGFSLSDPRHIELLGDACESFLSATNAMVSVRFPCNVFRPD